MFFIQTVWLIFLQLYRNPSFFYLFLALQVQGNYFLCLMKDPSKILLRLQSELQLFLFPPHLLTDAITDITQTT